MYLSFEEEDYDENYEEVIRIPFNYKLSSICYHSGQNITSGHYTSKFSFLLLVFLTLYLLILNKY